MHPFKSAVASLGRVALLGLAFGLAALGAAQGNSSIVGRAFLDKNGNGLQDEGDTVLANVPVRLTGPGIGVLDAKTNSLGNYSFTRLQEGTYYLMPQLNERYPLYFKEASGICPVVVKPGEVQRRNLPYLDLCAKVRTTRVLWDTKDKEKDKVTVTLSITNCTNLTSTPYPFQYIGVSLPTGVTLTNDNYGSATDNWIKCPTPILPGQAKTLTLELNGVKQASLLKYGLTFHSPDLSKCCEFRNCIEIPKCECFQIMTTRVVCNEDGTHRATIQFQSLEPKIVNTVAFAATSPSTTTFTPGNISIGNTGFGGIRTVTTTIGGPGIGGGMRVCFYLGLRKDGVTCCSKEICLDLPVCMDCRMTPHETAGQLLKYEFWPQSQDWNPFNANSYAAMTCYSTDIQRLPAPLTGMDYVVALKNLRNYQNAPPTLGANWTSANPLGFHNDGAGNVIASVNTNGVSVNYREHEWRRGNLGTPFGLTLDGEGNMYVAQSSAYNNDMPPLPGRWGTPTDYDHGTIFKIERVTGRISKFATLPNFRDPSIVSFTGLAWLGFSDLYQTSQPYVSYSEQNWPELGDVCFDPDNNRIYATNMEDGKIYAFNATSAAPLGSFDPLGADDGRNGFAPLGERLWAVQYHDGRVYYSVWSEDFENVRVNAANSVRSVEVDATGFLPTTDRHELSAVPLPVAWQNMFAVPNPVANDILIGTSAPISDIAFGRDGRMMLAERGMGLAWGWTQDGQANAADVPTTSTDYLKGARSATNTYPHNARGLEYICEPNRWRLQVSNNLFPFNDTLFGLGGFGGSPRNSSGGVDYDREVRAQVSGAKGPRVWFTADYMLGAWYGLQGVPLAGGNVTTNIILDANGFPSTQEKTYIGDVEIPRVERGGS